jgi:hypothetical protein
LTRIVGERVDTDRGTTIAARAHHLLGKSMAATLSQGDVSRPKEVMERYQTAKRHLTRVCEMGAAQWCSSSYLSVVELADALLGKLAAQSGESDAQKAEVGNALQQMLTQDKITYEKQSRDNLNPPLEGDDGKIDVESFIPKNP